jgi:hypothetical protein
MTSKLSLAVLAATVLLTGACGEGLTLPDNPLTLALQPESLDLMVGVTCQLQSVAVTPVPARVLFTSSDPAIAEVDTAGMVTALHRGRAVIRAHLFGAPYAADSVVVTVRDLSDCSDCGGYAQISLAAVTDTAGAAVDVTALRGTIDVQLYVDLPGRDTAITEVLVDSAAMCAIATPPGLLIRRTCRIDTEETAAGVPRFPAGEHRIAGLLRNARGMILASMNRTVTFAAAAARSENRAARRVPVRVEAPGS